MAMSSSSGGGDLNSEINVTPMIDVMLVLLVIFMVTAPLLNTGVDLDLPDVDAEKLVDKPEDHLILSIDKNAHLFLGQKQVKWAELQGMLEHNEKVKTESALYIEADGQLPYQYVVTAMAVAKKAKIVKVMMMTETGAEPDLATYDAK